MSDSHFTFFSRAFMSFHLMMQASKRLHNDMTHAVLRAKIEFFDTNPLGRILNRFSSGKFFELILIRNHVHSNLNNLLRCGK